MADQDDRAARGEVLLEQLEHLGLHRHIQCGGGFVGDQHLGIQCQPGGDQRPLAQPAGELAGQLPGAQLRLRDGDRGQQLLNAGGALRGGHSVRAQRLGDLGAHRAQRIQGDQGVLQHIADAAAAQVAELLGGRLEHVDPHVQGGRGDLGAVPVQAEQAAGGHGFAGAGFADDAEALPGAQREGHIAHHLLAVEGDGEIPDGDQCGHRSAPASVDCWRRRPSTVSDRVNRTMVTPGKKSIHQACWM